MSAAHVGVAYAASSGYTTYLLKSLSTVPHSVPVTVCWASEGELPDFSPVHPDVRVVRPRHVRSTFSRGCYLNIAMRNSQAEHVVLADADMLFPPGYFEVLRLHAGCGKVVRCWVGNISKSVSQAVLDGTLDWQSLYVDYPNAGFAEARPRRLAERLLRRLVWALGRATLGPQLRVEYREGRQFELVYGAANPCCYSMQDFIRIRGYDESFSGWGDEDNELTARGRMHGIADARMAVIVGHLWHGDMALREYPDYYARRGGERWAGGRAKNWTVNDKGWGDAPA